MYYIIQDGLCGFFWLPCLLFGVCTCEEFVMKSWQKSMLCSPDTSRIMYGFSWREDDIHYWHVHLSQNLCCLRSTPSEDSTTRMQQKEIRSVLGWALDNIYIYISGGPLSALTCCVNVRLLSAIKKISPLIYSQSWVGSWVYTTQAMMTFTLIF